MKLLTFLFLVGWLSYREVHPKTIVVHETYGSITLSNVADFGETIPVKSFRIHCDDLGDRLYQTTTNGTGCWDAKKQAFVWYQLEEQ